MPQVFICNDQAFSHFSEAEKYQKALELIDGADWPIDDYPIDKVQEELVWGGEGVWNTETSMLMSFNRAYFWASSIGTVKSGTYLVVKTRATDEAVFKKELTDNLRRTVQVN